MRNVMSPEIVPNADVSVVTVEIRSKCVASLAVAATVTVQVTKLARMPFVLIRVFMIMLVRHTPNAHHKITCQFASVKKVSSVIRTLIVDENHKLNVLLTPIVHRVWLASIMLA